jgi:hypothetical protein
MYLRGKVLTKEKSLG